MLKSKKRENQINLGLFFELAAENKIIYNQVPLDILKEDMEKEKTVFFTNGYFTLGDDGEIKTNRFFQDSSELAKFRKRLDKYDDHPSIYYKSKIYKYFRNCNRVNRSKRGRSPNEINNISEYEGENCFIPNGNGCFLKCFNYIFKKYFCREFLEFIQSYERRTNVMTRCRIPEFCE